MDQPNPYKGVFVWGKVITMDKGKVADDRIDKMAKKYTGADKYGSRMP